MKTIKMIQTNTLKNTKMKNTKMTTTKMKTITTAFTTVVAAFLLLTNAYGQSNDSWKWSVEIDPGTYALNGYSVHVRVQPKNMEHLLVGLGAYAMDMPDLFVNFNEKNKDMGWNVRINQGLGIFGEYYFDEVNKKWFVGAQLSLQEFKIEKTEVTGDQTYTNGLAMAYFGYSIKPFKNNLYFKPWAGMGYTSQMSGSNELQGHTYDISPISMFATLHIGYTF